MNEEIAEKKDFSEKISKFLPSVGKPDYKQSLNTRLKWTGIALFLYLLLSYIIVYGVEERAVTEFRYFEMITGSKFGSIMTLGIGPIVTSGIILQLLVGSKLVNWDLTKQDHKKKFQRYSKLLAVVFCLVEAIAFVLFGVIPVKVGSGFALLLFVILQIAMGGLIVILLDDLVSKWGFGQGVSLFIAVGVASQVFIGLLSPCGPASMEWLCKMTSPQEKIVGAIPGFFVSAIGGNMYFAVEYLILIVATILVFLVVVFAQNVSIEIPLAFSAMHGFGRTWGLKFLYTSVVPVILIGALLANMQFIGRIGMSTNEEGISCGPLGCNDQQGQAISGFSYYLSSPKNLVLEVVSSIFTDTPFKYTEFLRAFTYMTFLSLGAMLFSMLWVRTSGMGAKSVANQLDSSGLQIPGYRRDPRVMEAVLNKYIPSLAVMGGLAIGLLASVSDAIGAIGTGTGILLTVMICYNYYEQLKHEKLDEAHPLIKKIIGE